MRIWALLSFMACSIGFLLCGCGGGSSPAAPVSPLAGNWLIVGPFPTNGISLPPSPPTSGVRLAVTFDVVGNQAIAGGSGSNYCNNTQAVFRFGGLLPGTGALAPDGSFTLATSASDTSETISIKGTAPRTSGEPWSGSYAVSLGGFAPACDSNLSGTFTATSFPLVNGVYAGTGSTLAGPNGVPAAASITFQVTLKQGAMVTNPGNGAFSFYFSNAALAGSIKVQGSPCFSSGVAESRPPSGVAGNMVDANFLMDDGSTLNLTGSLTDISEGHIETVFVSVTGGSCGGINNLIQLPGLDRQS